MAPIDLKPSSIDLAKRCQAFYDKRIQRINQCDLEVLMRDQVLSEKRVLAEIKYMTMATPQDTVELRKHCVETKSFADKNMRNLRELATRQYETALRVKAEFLAALKGAPTRKYSEPAK